MVWHEDAQVGEFRLRERQFHGAASDSWLAESVGTGDPVRLAGMELPPHLEPLRDQVVAAVRSSLEQSGRLKEIGVVPGTLQVREKALLTVTPLPPGTTVEVRLGSSRVRYRQATYHSKPRSPGRRVAALTRASSAGTESRRESTADRSAA